VNPFILLLKPMMAVGTLVAKGVVSVAFLATEDGVDPGNAPHVSTEAAIVRVAVQETDYSLSLMEVQLPNGEFFQLAGVAPAAESEASGSRPKMGGRILGRSHTGNGRGGGATLAMLQSETGRSMQCEVSLPRAEHDGSGVCTTDTGEKYEFAFQL
jgi:hypothetical protein